MEIYEKIILSALIVLALLGLIAIISSFVTDTRNKKFCTENGYGYKSDGYCYRINPDETITRKKIIIFNNERYLEGDSRSVR